MPVTALLLFGGETLKDFAFALLVGVASGAYSSIFIATPVLVEWKEREQTYMRRCRLVMQEHGGLVPAFATGAIGEEAAPAPAGVAAATAGAGAAGAGAATAQRARRALRRAGRSRTPASADGEPPAPPARQPTPPPA